MSLQNDPQKKTQMEWLCLQWQILKYRRNDGDPVLRENRQPVAKVMGNNRTHLLIILRCFAIRETLQWLCDTSGYELMLGTSL